jgi:hypothetical protein
MTGMPAFGPTRTDDQVWALLAFVDVLPGISVADFASAMGSPTASVPVPAQTGG